MFLGSGGYLLSGGLGLLLGSRSSRAGRGDWLVLLDEVPGEESLMLSSSVVEILAGVPVVVLLFGDGYDLPDWEVQVILVRRGVLVDGLDLVRHGCTARVKAQAKAKVRSSREVARVRVSDVG